MSYFIDVGEQDQALADGIAGDQELLAEIHQTVEDTRTQTNELRQETAVQKRKLDRSLASLQDAKAELEAIEEKTRAELARQKAVFENASKDKAAARKALAKAQASQKRLQDRIAELVRRRSAQGRIPSVYNGSLALADGRHGDPELRLHRVWLEPAGGPVRRISTGASTSSRRGHAGAGVRRGDRRSTSAGTTRTATTRPGSWSSPTATSLQTWYAHMLPRHPNGIRSGSKIRAGQIIGYEGNTGHSTGAHLHWAVMFTGQLRQPAPVPVGAAAPGQASPTR